MTNTNRENWEGSEEVTFDPRLNLVNKKGRATRVLASIVTGK